MGRSGCGCRTPKARSSSRADASWRGELNEALVESGSRLNGALRADVVDELIVYLAPHLLGDTAGVCLTWELTALDGLR